MYLTTFKNELRKLNLHTRKDEGSHLMNIITASGSLVAGVSLVSILGFTTFPSGFGKLSNGEKKILVDLIVKFSSTPINEREPEEKYIYMFDLFEQGDEENFKMVRNGESIIDLDNSPLDYCMTCPEFHFTQNDYDELPRHLAVKFNACRKILVTTEGVEEL